MNEVSEAVARKLGASSAPRIGAAIEVEGLGVVVDVNADEPGCPNSTQKLVTAGAALFELTPGRRLRTDLYCGGGLDRNGILEGDLVLVAGGDPTMSSADVESLTAGVVDAGIRRVRGALVADDSRYDQARAVPGWSSHYVPRFCAPLSAFCIDGNRWRTDDEFLTHPVEANGSRVLAALEAARVQVDCPIRIKPSDGDGWRIWSSESPPMLELVSTMLERSSNFVAELLLKEIGAHHGAGSTQGGLDVVESICERLGVPPALQSTDGSGLSRRNRDTPLRQVSWLRAIEESSIGVAFVGCLPGLPNETALRNRLEEPGLGAIVAKTGTRPYGGSVSLAGYATLRDQSVRFSFMLSGARSVAKGRRAIDSALVAALRRIGRMIG